LRDVNANGSLKLVAIGGGTGLSTLLAGLKRYVGARSEELWIDSLSAIVTVSDDGGSSGRLREELQMLPPGDIRNCMIALSEDSTLLSRLFRHRFGGSGDLGGHSFGNLFLAAMTDITGDFAEAVRLSSEVLASKGHIFPATLADVHLVAEMEDGSEIHGETQITAARARIKTLRLAPDNCRPLPATLDAIGAADVITIGPGSLYTSIIPNLLVEGVADAIGNATATRMFIGNLMTQPGETDGFSFREHLETVRSYAPQIKFDYALANDRPISDAQADMYQKDGAFQIMFDDHADQVNGGIEVVRADLLDGGDMVRHDSARLADIVMACVANECSRNLAVL
jgi:uncharacterized cofD-like protein